MNKIEWAGKDLVDAEAELHLALTTFYIAVKRYEEASGEDLTELKKIIEPVYPVIGEYFIKHERLSRIRGTIYGTDLSDF